MELEVARILFNNARLVDGTGKPPVPGCSVLVEG
jgi:hypothetical protein